MEGKYRTLITFGGKQYISVAEHEEIIKAISDFNSAVDRVQEALNVATSLTKATGKVVESVEI